MNPSEFDDYWISQAGSSHKEPLVQLELKSILNVVPLDDQFGAEHAKAAPEALFEPLFGEAKNKNALQHASNASTFALLDAAKVPALPELLGASGLVHRCLFKGDAYEELKDVAPWIVRLEESNSFTRHLFTRSDAPWSLWDTEPGLYLRSSGTLDQLWAHFRRFTRVQDEAGRWFYFRFWETNCLIDYVRFAENKEHCDLRPFFGFDPDSPSRPLVESYISTGVAHAEICSVSSISGHNSEGRAGIDMSIVRFLALRGHAHRFVDSYFDQQARVPSADHRKRARDIATHIVQKYYAFGFKSRYHLGSFVYWALILNADFENRTPLIQDQIRRTTEDPNDRFVLISREMKSMFGPKVRNYRGYGT